jgi:predicted metalloprotease
MNKYALRRSQLAAFDVITYLLLLTFFLLVGCSSASPVDPAPQPAFPKLSVTIPPAPTRTPDATGTDPTNPPAVDPAMQEDIDSAVKVVDSFWSNHFNEAFSGTYSAPQVSGMYDGTNGPTCAGEASLPDNAFYCKAGDFLAWDQGLMTKGYANGDAFVYLVIAHEWGHAIQARIDPTLVSEAPELQADCFAGAALQGAVNDGTLNWEANDSNEITRAYSDLGDGTPWTDPSSHGTGLDRVQAFVAGQQQGVAGCLPKQGK